mmetsp:Transcript_37293/g.97729  ORF Transcript_37293/g.97729 Transcript_37293/m.97729 type:complete len:225 (+) Transcript_37293:644-1318(+)
MCSIDKMPHFIPAMYPLDLHDIPGLKPVTCRSHSQRLAEDEDFCDGNTTRLCFGDCLTRCNSALFQMQCVAQQIGGACAGHDRYSIFLSLPILSNHTTGGLQGTLALDGSLQWYNAISQIAYRIGSVVRHLHTSDLDACRSGAFRRCPQRLRINVHWRELHVTGAGFGLSWRSFESALTADQPIAPSNGERNKNRERASNRPGADCQHLTDLRPPTSEPNHRSA